jgi:hypothetical protein
MTPIQANGGTVNGAVANGNTVVKTVHDAAAGAVAKSPETAGIPYTTFHMSALAFVHPGGRPSHLKQCCVPNPTPENAGRPKDQHIRVYHAEPSHHSYNHGYFVIRESRYTTQQGWHAPKVDDLVADDAAAGSAVCAIGWWAEEQVWHVSQPKPLE